MDEDNAKIAGAFLLGGLVGATIALLYAPKSGHQTRRDISKAARRMKNEAADIVEDTVDSINDFASGVKERVSDIIDRGVELSDHAKREIVRTFEQGQKTFEKQKNRIIEGLGL